MYGHCVCHHILFYVYILLCYNVFNVAAIVTTPMQNYQIKWNKNNIFLILVEKNSPIMKKVVSLQNKIHV